MLILIKIERCQIFTVLFLTIFDENLLVTKHSYEQNKLLFSCFYIYPNSRMLFCGSFSLDESWVEKNFIVFH